MRELFFKLFEMSHFDTGISVTAFSISHIVYIILITGSIVGLYMGNRRATIERKKKILDLLVILLTVSYISDFFVHEFVYAETVDGVIVGGGLNMDKLPFHICVVLCPLSAFVQFNSKFRKYIEPVAMLAVLAPMMYLAYPANIGTGEPWCYQAVQTMFYHGTLMAWGILNLAFGIVIPDVRKCYQAATLLVGITLWAKLGNLLFEHNWFFLEEDAFYIGLVEKGIISKWLLMIVNPLVFFAAILALYGFCHLLHKLKKEKRVKIQDREKEKITL